MSGFFTPQSMAAAAQTARVAARQFNEEQTLNEVVHISHKPHKNCLACLLKKYWWVIAAVIVIYYLTNKK